jgi:hypothetical protein
MWIYFCFIEIIFSKALSRHVQTRALVVALALTLPLAVYGIPYAYAVTTSSSYVVKTVDLIAPANGHADSLVTCHSGDYATGGGFSADTDTHYYWQWNGPQPPDSPPTNWHVALYNPDSSSKLFGAFVVCQTPITVAGVSVPEFGQLYIAIALGALIYFVMARRFSMPKTITAKLS